MLYYELKIRASIYLRSQGDAPIIIIATPICFHETATVCFRKEKEMENNEKPKRKQNYKREMLRYQEWTFYCVFFIAVLAAVLFLRILFTPSFP